MTLCAKACASELRGWRLVALALQDHHPRVKVDSLAHQAYGQMTLCSHNSTMSSSESSVVSSKALVPIPKGSHRSLTNAAHKMKLYLSTLFQKTCANRLSRYRDVTATRSQSHPHFFWDYCLLGPIPLTIRARAERIFSRMRQLQVSLMIIWHAISRKTLPTSDQEKVEPFFLRGDLFLLFQSNVI